MDNGLLLVNFGSLSQASDEIGTALKELNSRLEELKSDGSRLAETWDGVAKAAYYERQAKWEAAAGDLAGILRQIQVAVDDSKADYHDTERRATNRFQ
jgi:WXG100 family type VII secretion target